MNNTHTPVLKQHFISAWNEWNNEYRGPRNKTTHPYRHNGTRVGKPEPCETWDYRGFQATVSICVRPCLFPGFRRGDAYGWACSLLMVPAVPGRRMMIG